LIKSFKENISGFKNGYLIDTASQIGVRDSRRIRGMHYFTEEDIGKNFEDTIAKAPNYTKLNSGPLNIPYKCLISEKIENLIFAGRCISVDHKLFNMFREIPCCMATGQAAGVAAAIAAKTSNTSVHKIDTQNLRKILLEQKAVI
jgi:hypothetical protein